MTKTKKDGYWLNKKVAVTGAGGFLGSHFVTELESLGAEVSSFSREKVDLLSSEKTTIALSNIDVIVNCAAIDGNAEFKKNHAAEILDANMRISSNVLNAAKNNQIKEVVLISSSEIYSGFAPNPVKETDDYRTFGGHTESGYILSKRYSEILATLYQEQYGFNVYLPRPSNIFGPGDHFGEQSTRVIPSFISKIVTKMPIEIWGDGSQVKQFIYVKNVVDAVLSTVENKNNGVINISTNEYISILELAKKISSLLDIEADIRLDNTKSIGSKSRILDTTKMYQLTHTNPMSLEEGLVETIKWYKNKFYK